MFADVTSANIVGYGPTVLPKSGVTIGPSFVKISGEKFDLTELEVKGYEQAGETYGDVVVQTLKPGGGTDRTFTWYDYTDGERIVGWFEIVKGEYIPLEKNDVMLDVGEGLWSSTGANGLSIQSSGEVPTQTDVPTALPKSGLAIANPTPATVDLIDCSVTGYEETTVETYGDVVVQTLKPGGGTDRTFTWYDYTDGDRIVGWFEIVKGEYIDLKRNDVTMDPGRGLWTSTSANGLYFVWPKVDVK